MKKWLLSTVQCALCTNKNFSISAAKAAKINFYKPFCNIIVERERTSQKILTKIGTTGCTQAFLLPYNGLMIGFPGEQHYEATPLVDSVSAADTTGNATQEQHNSDPRAATSCSPILSRCFSFAEWISIQDRKPLIWVPTFEATTSLVIMLTSCTLPWTRSPTCDSESSLRDDSAFHEPEYASPAETRNSSLEGHPHHQDYANGVMIRRLSKIDLEESFVGIPPDYEEVDPVQVQQLRRALSNKMRKSDKNADNNTQRIMKSLIYCIHKVMFNFKSLLILNFPRFILFCV